MAAQPRRMAPTIQQIPAGSSCGNADILDQDEETEAASRH
jgi:hypothetical protein